MDQDETWYAGIGLGPGLKSDVDRVELFRLTLIFFDDASKFPVTSLYVVFILSSNVMLIFLFLALGEDAGACSDFPTG